MSPALSTSSSSSLLSVLNRTLCLRAHCGFCLPLVFKGHKWWADAPAWKLTHLVVVKYGCLTQLPFKIQLKGKVQVSLQDRKDIFLKITTFQGNWSFLHLMILQDSCDIDTECLCDTYYVFVIRFHRNASSNLFSSSHSQVVLKVEHCLFPVGVRSIRSCSRTHTHTHTEKCVH